MSLFELIVALTILSTITALGIANFPDIGEAANAVNTENNVREIARTYNAAVTAGYRGTPADVAEAVEAVTTGIPLLVGNVTYHFRVDGLSSNEVEFARKNLSISKEGNKVTLVPLLN